MLDVYADLSKQSTVFGTHIELLEMCELKKYRDEATETEVQKKIEEFNFTMVDETITASFGIAEYNMENSIEQFISKADKKLYQAKKNGRNRVEK